METPFNENLVLASLGCNDPVIAAFQTTVPGGACQSTTPLSPGHRNQPSNVERRDYWGTSSPGTFAMAKPRAVPAPGRTSKARPSP